MLLMETDDVTNLGIPIEKCRLKLNEFLGSAVLNTQDLVLERRKRVRRKWRFDLKRPVKTTSAFWG